ncbi:MAG: hypothetical protein WC829_12220 [Hyphomicrobium sp.]|jgi:hypothetical protein
MTKQTMCRTLTALCLVVAVAAPAYAACKDEVASALERQRHTSGFRMKTKMLSDQGLVDMTVDYVLPNRMRQVITSTTEPKPVETVVIGRDAWSRVEGEQWRPLHPQVADALAAQMQETLGEQEEDKLGDFECLGKQAVADTQYLAYQGENVEPGPENRSPDAAAKPKLPDRPVRVIYVDTTTGLPMRSIYARANKLDKPIFEATYSYPADIKVDAPPFPGAAPEQPAEKK